MTWTNRVVWQEGMFLRAQHFQQQDRWLETLVRSRTAAMRPYPWGVIEMAIDRDLLATGRFALTSAAGVFEDGTPFAIPGETDHPAPLELPDSTRNALVYLAAPVRQAGAIEVGNGDGTEGRYALRDFEAYDTHSASSQPAPLQVGRLRLRYMLESEERAGYHCIGLARVAEVSADRRVRLDDNWIPPALICAATVPLAGMITQFAGMLNQRGEPLAEAAGALGRFRQRAPRGPLRRPGSDGRRIRHVHRADATAQRLPGLSPRGSATQLRAGRGGSAALAVGRARTGGDPDTAAGAALRRARRGDHGPLDPARRELRAGRAGRRADRDGAPCLPVPSQDRRGRADPRPCQRRDPRYRSAAAARRAAADPVLCRRLVFRPRPQQPALA